MVGFHTNCLNNDVELHVSIDFITYLLVIYRVFWLCDIMFRITQRLKKCRITQQATNLIGGLFRITQLPRAVIGRTFNITQVLCAVIG